MHLRGHDVAKPLPMAGEPYRGRAGSPCRILGTPEEPSDMSVPKLFDLSGKVALITGGNSGIGLGMADGLAASGASVCIWGTSEDKNSAAAEQLRKHGGRVLAMRCDVSDEAAVERGFAETV